MSNGITNRDFVQQNEGFIKACGDAGIPATKRQASKFKAGKGMAYYLKTGRGRPTTDTTQRSAKNNEKKW